ncbi:MAG: amidohydrolase family protein, partial [Anaerolineae bacterium]|nr:amidohydrolase family protein [Anaerolineae bacterium]
CAREHDWPILTHTDSDGTTMDARQYEPLVKAYPTVPLILAHLRWGAIPLAKRYDNVFLDTTYMDASVVEIGLDALGPAKILFGSDAAEGFDIGRPPKRERPHRSYLGLVNALRERGITERSLEKICYENTKLLFNIQEV